jgi:hypothetical protein
VPVSNTWQAPVFASRFEWARAIVELTPPGEQILQHLEEAADRDFPDAAAPLFSALDCTLPKRLWRLPRAKHPRGMRASDACLLPWRMRVVVPVTQLRSGGDDA